MSDLLVTVVTGALIAVGILGTLLPILPGLVLIWAAMIGYGMLTGFGWVGWIAVILATGLAALGVYLNVRIPQRRAAESGITVAGQLVGLALAVVGFFVVPVVGAAIGFVLGVFLVRLRSTGDRTEAWKATRTVVGSLVRASIAQAACGTAMAVVWAVWAIFTVTGFTVG